MSQAIWILQYDLIIGSEQQYLSWFHGIHIPEKLARSGYLWAAHYKGQIGVNGSNKTNRSYLALFGGISTRAFLNPSPSELRDLQDDLTKEMMGKRISSKGTVFALEWSVDGHNDLQEPTSLHLNFFSIRADGNEEEIGSWAARSLPSLEQPPVSNGSQTYKLISVTGGDYHGILHDAGFHPAVSPNQNIFCKKNLEFSKNSTVEHFNGQRIWPL